MKKPIAILLTIAILLSLAACGGGEPDPNAGKYQGISAKGCYVMVSENQMIMDFDLDGRLERAE